MSGQPDDGLYDGLYPGCLGQDHVDRGGADEELDQVEDRPGGDVKVGEYDQG